MLILEYAIIMPGSPPSNRKSPAKNPSQATRPVPKLTSYQLLRQQLGERVKELALLHSAARLLQGTRPTLMVLDELTALLPPAWQYPEICAARITYADVATTTSNWCDSPWKMAARFTTSDMNTGLIEVVYLQEKPAEAEGPFLIEERALIDSITELLVAYLERRRAEDKILQLAYSEAVTGLPNRVSLEERLASAIETARAEQHLVALMLINLHDFHIINNTLGHRNGDVVLRQVAQALRAAIPAEDLLASLGGGEFVILLAHLATHENIVAMINRIEASLRRPAQVAGVQVNIEGTIGIALHPDHGDTPELLLQRVDVALRAARASHRDHLFYSPEIDLYEPQRIALLGELPAAIEHNQLRLHYQPKIDLKSGRTVAVEALVRWQHPIHGLIFPDRFVLLAERTQVINPLTRWVLEQALRQWQAWHHDGLELGISINLSARNLLDPGLGPRILALARAAGLALHQLTLEITESAIMADPARARSVMGELFNQGIQFSMDDFGVGQSSLSYLKDLPISQMKIDKSFVMGYAEPRNAHIVRAAIELGHSLDMQITAEGIEAETTYRALQKLGCDLGQGYLFSSPLPVDRLLVWLRQSQWGAVSLS